MNGFEEAIKYANKVKGTKIIIKNGWYCVKPFGWCETLFACYDVNKHNDGDVLYIS